MVKASDGDDMRRGLWNGNYVVITTDKLERS